MKTTLTVILILISAFAFGQDLNAINRKLTEAFGKLNYWAYNKFDDDKIDAGDSLEKANDNFEKLLLKYTSFNPATLNSNFKSLSDSGLIIVTSEDSLFRIYSWNTKMGGTMRIFRNVYQYKIGGKVFSTTIDRESIEELDPGCSYEAINDIISNNKKFYITQSRSILSSGLSYYNIKLFSFDNFKLNDTARLIKTKTGIKNQLGYGVDLTASSNRDRDVPDFSINYDKAKKTITIPVIMEDGRVTEKKIVYQFTGQYFEKLK